MGGFRKGGFANSRFVLKPDVAIASEVSILSVGRILYEDSFCQFSGEIAWVDLACADCPGFLVLGATGAPPPELYPGTSDCAPELAFACMAPSSKVLDLLTQAVQKRDAQRKLLQHEGADTEFSLRIEGWKSAKNFPTKWSHHRVFQNRIANLQWDCHNVPLLVIHQTPLQCLAKLELR